MWYWYSIVVVNGCQRTNNIEWNWTKVGSISYHNAWLRILLVLVVVVFGEWNVRLTSSPSSSLSLSLPKTNAELLNYILSLASLHIPSPPHLYTHVRNRMCCTCSGQLLHANHVPMTTSWSAFTTFIELFICHTIRIHLPTCAHHHYHHQQQPLTSHLNVMPIAIAIHFSFRFYHSKYRETFSLSLVHF